MLTIFTSRVYFLNLYNARAQAADRFSQNRCSWGTFETPLEYKRRSTTKLWLWLDLPQRSFTTCVDSQKWFNENLSQLERTYVTNEDNGYWVLVSWIALLPTLLSQRWSTTCLQSVSPVSQHSSSLFSPQNVALSTSRQAHQGEEKLRQNYFQKTTSGPS